MVVGGVTAGNFPPTPNQHLIEYTHTFKHTVLASLGALLESSDIHLNIGNTLGHTMHSEGIHWEGWSTLFSFFNILTLVFSSSSSFPTPNLSTSVLLIFRHLKDPTGGNSGLPTMNADTPTNYHQAKP